MVLPFWVGERLGDLISHLGYAADIQLNQVLLQPLQSYGPVIVFPSA